MKNLVLCALSVLYFVAVPSRAGEFESEKGGFSPGDVVTEGLVKMEDTLILGYLPEGAKVYPSHEDPIHRPSDRGGPSGTCFTATLREITEFHTRFKFRISEVEEGGILNIKPRGDGIVFCIQGVFPHIRGRSDTLGDYFGYAGIAPSVAVEFDTRKHEFDPDDNHIGINLNGNVRHPRGMFTVGVKERFDNGKVWTAWIDYDGTTLEVRVSQDEKRPEKPNITCKTNIPVVLGSETAYMGFCGSKLNESTSKQEILHWYCQYGPATADKKTK